MVTIEKTIEGVTAQSLARFTERARRAAGVPGKVNVLVTGRAAMRRLNRAWRGKDEATDVLSFPPTPVVAGEFAGDIVICAEIAAENARAYQLGPGDEVKLLVLHGILHLAGGDHERDEGAMARKEARLRKQLKLSAGLIERTEAPRPRRGQTTRARRRS